MLICLRSHRNLCTMHSKWRNNLLHLLKRGFRVNFLMSNSIGTKYIRSHLKCRQKQKLENLNNVVFTNEKLFKIRMIDSPQCTFCKNEIEFLEHLFYSCEITRSFWVALRAWLIECNINLEPLSVVNVLFGIFNAGENFVILNHLILVAKFYIQCCRLYIFIYFSG